MARAKKQKTVVLFECNDVIFMAFFKSINFVTEVRFVNVTDCGYEFTDNRETCIGDQVEYQEFEIRVTAAEVLNQNSDCIGADDDDLCPELFYDIVFDGIKKDAFSIREAKQWCEDNDFDYTDFLMATVDSTIELTATNR